MKKLTAKNLRAVMAALAREGDRDSYDKLWKAVTWLWNLQLLDDRLYRAAVREDHRLFESGESAPMCEKPYDLSVLDEMEA